MKPVICFEMLYPGMSANGKIERIADHGFDAIEFWGWKDKEIGSLAETCRRRGVRVANFSGHRAGSPVAKETHEAVLSDYRDALAAARALQCHTLMFLSNELGEGGAVVDTFSSITGEEMFRNFVDLLLAAVEITPADLTIVIEPLNTRVDHRGNYLHDMETAVRIVEAVGSPRVRILSDLYHLGVMGFDLEEVLQRYLPSIGYIHVADFPGRHEPGTGSANWERVISILQMNGYAGDVGFEYAPHGDSDASLEAIRRLLARQGILPASLQ